MPMELLMSESGVNKLTMADFAQGAVQVNEEFRRPRGVILHAVLIRYLITPNPKAGAFAQLTSAGNDIAVAGTGTA